MLVGTLGVLLHFTRLQLVIVMLLLLTILLTLWLLWLLSFMIQCLALTCLLMCCGRRGMCM